MKIGVYFESEVSAGGSYQYIIRTIHILKKINKDEFKFFYFTNNKKIAYSINKEFGIEVELIRLTYIDYINLIIRRFLKIYIKRRFFFNYFFKNKIENILNKFSIDLVYFLQPTLLSYFMEYTNFIYTVWDLSHRDFMEFPEVRSNFEFEVREKIYNSTLKKSIAVMADSYLGKQNIVRRYGIDEKRVYVSKFLPPIQSKDNNEFIDIKKNFGIKNDYIYYPAQFWSHKNHIYILEAIKIMKEKFNVDIDAIFTGNDYGNLNYILEYSKKINVYKQIHYLGFVEAKLIPNLYRQSIALVMPTYFGPTNLPPLEAFSLGVPVFYSNLEGLRDQVGDAAILLNLEAPEDLAIKLIKLIKGEISKSELIKNGKNKLAELTEDNFINLIVNILNDYNMKLRCWRN